MHFLVLSTYSFISWTFQFYYLLKDILTKNKSLYEIIYIYNALYNALFMDDLHFQYFEGGVSYFSST